MDITETGKVLASLRAAWPDRTVDRETVAAYQRALADLSYEAVNAAVDCWLHTGRFFPVPSELRALALEEPAGLPAPEVAWEEVRRQIAAVGMYGIPIWTSGALADTVRAIGWREICVCDEGELGTLRAQFRETYRAYQRRWLGGDAGAALDDASRRRAALARGESSSPAAAIGAEAPITVRARPAPGANGRPKALPAPRPETLARLMAMPSWQELPEDVRRDLEARHGGRS